MSGCHFGVYDIWLGIGIYCFSCFGFIERKRVEDGIDGKGSVIEGEIVPAVAGR